jgi:hypothetical protein
LRVCCRVSVLVELCAAGVGSVRMAQEGHGGERRTSSLL